MTPRAERLQQRFDALQEAVSLSVGKDAAFAAASCTWLMVIEHSARQSMTILSKVSAAYPPGTVHPRLPEFKEELREELQGFHQALCKHLGVPHERALELSHHFDQIMQDIIEGKG